MQCIAILVNHVLGISWRCLSSPDYLLALIIFSSPYCHPDKRLQIAITYSLLPRLIPLDSQFKSKYFTSHFKLNEFSSLPPSHIASHNHKILPLSGHKSSSDLGLLIKMIKVILTICLMIIIITCLRFLVQACQEILVAMRLVRCTPAHQILHTQYTIHINSGK